MNTLPEGPNRVIWAHEEGVREDTGRRADRQMPRA
jgi:hypothetical protein